MKPRQTRFHAALVVAAIGLFEVVFGADAQLSSAPSQNDLGVVFGKHDGRRGPSNPYTQRIDAIAKKPISSGDGASSVLAARFALMGEPLEEEETPPKPPSPSPLSESQQSATNAKPAPVAAGAAPAPSGERATRFDQ